MKKMDLEWLNIAPLIPDYKDEITADIRKMYADGIITSTAFSMTLVPEGDPVVDKASILGKRFSDFRAALKDSDVPVGILLQATMGHGWTPSVPAKYSKFMLGDGSEPYTFCPLGEEFKEYIRNMIRTLGKLKPAFFMLDDDTRMITGRNGCYCNLHVDRFNREQGTNYDRESLRKAVETDREVARAYWDLQNQSIVELAQVIREAIDETDPQIHCSFCTCCVEVPVAGKIAKTLGAPGHDITIRINHGLYKNESLSYYPLWMWTTARQAQFFPKEYRVLAEPDTCPQNRYSTSAAMMHAHITGSIIEGCNGGKMWITRMGQKELASGVRYRETLNKYKHFYRTLATLDVKWNGINALFPNRDFIPFPDGEKYGIFAHPWQSLVLGKMGLPIQFHYAEDLPEKGETVTLAGGELKFHSDAGLEYLLKHHNVVLDGVAAAGVCKRGFAHLIGVEAQERTAKTCTQELFPNGDRINFTNGCSELKPLPGTEVLSTIYHKESAISPEKEEMGAGMTFHINPEGGKVAVMAAHLFGVWDGFNAFSVLNETRKKYLVEIFKRMDALPWYLPGDDLLTLKTGTLPDGSDLIFGIGIGFDDINGLNLAGVKADSVTAVEELMPDGSWKALPFTGSDGILSIGKTLAPLRPFVARICS